MWQAIHLFVLKFFTPACLLCVIVICELTNLIQERQYFFSHQGVLRFPGLYLLPMLPTPITAATSLEMSRLTICSEKPADTVISGPEA